MKAKIHENAKNTARLYQLHMSQAISIAWAEHFEERLAIIEAKYQGSFDLGWVFDCYCYDCKTGNAFRAPNSIRLFILEHKGHNTKTFKR